MFLKIAVVALGGGLGSALRYAVVSSLPVTAFPLGTTVVNLLGCFLIGFLVASMKEYSLSPLLLLFLMTGGLGAFTTFSTYMLDIAQLSQKNMLSPFLYMLISNVLGGVLFWIGTLIGSR